MTKNRGTKGFQCRSIFRDQETMVRKEGAQAHCKHGCDEKHEQDVKLSIVGSRPISTPEANKISHRESEDCDAVEEGVEEKQYEELVVIETDAVVDPGAMMIHLNHDVFNRLKPIKMVQN